MFEHNKDYTLIDASIYSDMITHISINFTDTELNDIRKVLDDLKLVYNLDIKYGDVPFNGVNTIIDSDLPYASVMLKGLTNDNGYYKFTRISILEIVKFDDEWYYLFISKANEDKSMDNYYKCDQFNGLLQCLKDNLL